jgi:hypothetical protein
MRHAGFVRCSLLAAGEHHGVSVLVSLIPRHAGISHEDA